MGFQFAVTIWKNPRTGTFDGLTITIDPDVAYAMQCFILLHLFGHSVQWGALKLAPSLDALQNTDDKEAFLKTLRAYEFEAAEIGMQLMHETGIHDWPQWYSDFVGNGLALHSTLLSDG